MGEEERWGYVWVGCGVPALGVKGGYLRLKLGDVVKNQLILERICDLAFPVCCV